MSNIKNKGQKILPMDRAVRTFFFKVTKIFSILHYFLLKNSSNNNKKYPSP